MKRKIIIGTLLLFILLSTAYATVNDFQAPNGWDNKGNGAFFGPNLGEGLIVMEYTDENVKDFIDNELVSIQKDSSTNIMTYKDSDLKQHGVMEVIEVNGSKYIVQAWAGEQSTTTDDLLLGTLNNFNTANNVKPIAT